MRRLQPAVVVVVAALVGACSAASSPGSSGASVHGSELPGASGLPVATPPPTPAAPPPTQSAVPTAPADPPTAPPSAPPSDAFRFADVLSIAVDDLPVHVAPTTTSAGMLGFREGQPIGEVHLGRQDYVSVFMGPLAVDGEAWYLVWPAEGGQLGYSLTYWQPAGAYGGSNPGWVQATNDGRSLLELQRRPPPGEPLPWEPVLVASGDADYVSPPQPRHDLFGLSWAAAANGGPCDFAMRLVPIDGPDPVVAAEASTGTVVQSPTSGPDSMIQTGWPMYDSAWESYVVEVTSRCPWAFALTPVGHD